jgi:hypothetical protein
MLTAYRERATDLSDEEFRRNAAEVLRATKFRSWRALEAGAKSCLVDEESGVVEFTPLRNGGTRGPKKGFQPFGATVVTSSTDAANEVMGRALMTALSSSL